MSSEDVAELGVRPPVRAGSSVLRRWAGRVLLVTGAGVGICAVGAASASADDAVVVTAVQTVLDSTSTAATPAAEGAAPQVASSPAPPPAASTSVSVPISVPTPVSTPVPAAVPASVGVETAEAVTAVGGQGAVQAGTGSVAPAVEDLGSALAPVLETAGTQLPSATELGGVVTAVVDEVAPSAPAVELPRPSTATGQAEVTAAPEIPVQVVVGPVRRSIDTIGVEVLASPRLAPGDLMSAAPSSVASWAVQPATLPFGASGALGATGGAGGAGGAGAANSSGQDGGSADLAVRGAGNPLDAGGRCAGAACAAARHVAFDPSFSPD